MMQTQEDTLYETASGLRTLPAKGTFHVNIIPVFLHIGAIKQTEKNNSTVVPKPNLASAATRSDLPNEVARRIHFVLNSCDEETVEAGIESAPAKALARLVHQCGDAAITELACWLSGQPTDLLTGQEILSWLGQIRHQPTRAHRRWLLERMLFHPHQTLRYGAIIGLSFLDAHESLVAVRKALQKEATQHLRQLLTQLIAQLQETQANDAFTLQGD